MTAHECPLILWHPDGQRVAWQAGEVPRLMLKASDPPAQVVREELGIEAWTLHGGGVPFGHAGTVQLQALAEALPPGWNWAVPAEEPTLPRARRWQRPGWRAEVLKWLSEQGVQLHGTEQVSTYDLNTILRVEGDGETLFLKVGESPLESAVTAHLARRLPELSPPLVAARGEWLLTKSGGVLLDSVGESKVWEQAVRRLARFQTEADTAELTALGCPSLPLAEMTERVDELLMDTAALQGWGLKAEKVEALRAARARVRRGFEELAALGLPDLPAHGDAHPRNALYGERGAVWFDWSEAKAAAHPLMDLGWFLFFALHPTREMLPIRQAVSDLEAQLSGAYADALGCPQTADCLSTAIPLALLHRAAVYDRTFRSWEGTVPGQRPQYVPYYLGQAVAELGRLPHL